MSARHQLRNRVTQSDRDHAEIPTFATPQRSRFGKWLALSWTDKRALAQSLIMMPKTAGLRRPGSAALDLAYVAAGFYDGFWEMKLNQWDMAAGALMILEAGRLVTGIDEEDSYMDFCSIVAGTPKMFAEMLTTLQKNAQAPQLWLRPNQQPS